MYSIVLMTALLTGGDAPAFGSGYSGCWCGSGCGNWGPSAWGCHGPYSNWGCGCYGYICCGGGWPVCGGCGHGCSCGHGGRCCGRSCGCGGCRGGWCGSGCGNWGCGCYGYICCGGGCSLPSCGCGCGCAAPVVPGVPETMPKPGGVVPKMDEKKDDKKDKKKDDKKDEKKDDKKDNKDKELGEAEVSEAEVEYAPAKIIVNLPAEAKLYFNGRPTTKETDRREFESPPLDPGMIYQYTLKAEVLINGKREVETKKVEVRAGQKTTVIFTLPTSVAGK